MSDNRLFLFYFPFIYNFSRYPLHLFIAYLYIIYEMSDLSDSFQRHGATPTSDHLQQQQNEVQLLFSIYTDKEVVDLRPSNTKKVIICSDVLSYSMILFNFLYWFKII